jgi:hypothetical protein
MIFRLAVRKTIFVSYCSQKLDLRLQLKAAVLYFLLIANRFGKTNNHFEKVNEIGEAVVSHFQRRRVGKAA